MTKLESELCSCESCAGVSASMFRNAIYLSRQITMQKKSRFIETILNHVETLEISKSTFDISELSYSCHDKEDDNSKTILSKSE